MIKFQNTLVIWSSLSLKILLYLIFKKTHHRKSSLFLSIIFIFFFFQYSTPPKTQIRKWAVIVLLYLLFTSKKTPDKIWQGKTYKLFAPWCYALHAPTISEECLAYTSAILCTLTSRRASPILLMHSRQSLQYNYS